MRYFLDFDRTLFDTEKFLSLLGEKINVSNLNALTQEERSAVLSRAYEATPFSFLPGELTPFVYGDVAEFLHLAANNATIITYGAPVVQELKIRNALARVPRVQVIYTGSKRKGPFVLEQLGESGSEAVFVDDTVSQLESVAASCPSAHLFEMRRDGKPGDGRWPVITSLYELP